jgi:peptide/nickel transport system permease protein
MTAVDSGAALPASTANPAVEDSPARRALRRLLRRKGAVVGLVIVLAFVLFALLANLIAPYSPIEADWSALRGEPTLEHPFGGDELGRDVLSRVIHGSRASLFAGVISVLLALLIGIPVGLLSGYAGGLVDGIIMRFTDAMLAVPFLILAIAMAAFLGPSLTNAMIAIGIAAAPIFVRLTRAQVQTVKVEDYVEAARAVGNPPWRIAFRHILPNIWPALLVQATLTIASAIIAEASLSFLGLGQQPPEPSWGSMLNSAKDYMTDAPWMAIYPGLSIFMVVLSFNLLGDGLRDAFDPRHKD